MSGRSEIEVKGEQGTVSAGCEGKDIAEGLFQRLVVQVRCGKECGRPAAGEGCEMQGFLRDASQTAGRCVFVPGVKGTGDETGNEVNRWNQSRNTMAAGEYPEEKKEREADSEGDTFAGSV